MSKITAGGRSKESGQKWVVKAKALKALGLIDYDLRKKLTRGQKWWISTLYNRVEKVVSHPKEFKKIKVKDKDVKKVMRADYLGAGENYFVPKGVYSKVSLVKHADGDITKDPAAFFSALFNAPFVVRESEMKVEYHFLIPGLQLLEAIELATEKYGNLQTPGWVWTFAFKGCNPFNRVRASLGGAGGYLQAMMRGEHLKTGNDLRQTQQLISGIVLIARKLEHGAKTPKVARRK